MADTTARLGLDYMTEGEQTPWVTFNDALNLLDVLAGRIRIIDRDLTAPPGSPSEGDAYIPAATATGDWSGDEGTIQVYWNSWITITPKVGMVAFVSDEGDAPLYYDGLNWVSIAPRSVESGITAATTQSQGQGPLTREINHVGTVANANDVVTLPAAFLGAHCVIYNRGANTLQVFPASGDRVDGASVDASFTIAANGSIDLDAIDATDWFSK